MRTELPLFKRCCFCLPLRHGLLAWVYFKLMIDCIMVFGVLLTLYLMIVVFYDSHHKHILSHIVVLIIVVMDLVFNCIFIIGAHNKQVKLLKTYYIYSGVLWGITVFIAIFSIIYTAAFIDDVIAGLIYIFIYVVVQTYFLLLIRSELIKLKNIGNFEFVNNAVEAECTLKIEYDYTEEDISDDDFGEQHEVQNQLEIKTCEKVNGMCGSKTCCKIVLNSERFT